MNVFTVECTESGRLYRCAIKGKVLKLESGYYNPVCPGDIALFTAEDTETGRLIAIEPRRNVWSRYNEKGRKPQLLAANIDSVFVIASPAHPPFRPRFIDRVLIQCEKAGIPGIIVLNKTDLLETPSSSPSLPSPPAPLTESIFERLALFESMGYTVLKVSAKTGEGLGSLCAACAGKISVFTGQSGAGKSSLINMLFGAELRKTGGLALKHDRGAHTTVMSALLEGTLQIPADGERSASDSPLRASIIDTPGLRQFVPCGISARDLPLYMRDLSPFASRCKFGASCAHASEPGCAVLAALNDGVIHPDRWNTYMGLKEALP
jgi:ribosome biogenesis GTPase